MREDGKIDYVELPGGDLVATKSFYQSAFGWTFTDYGPSYAAFEEGLDGGFDADAVAQAEKPPAGPSSNRSSASQAAGASTSATRRATNWRSGRRAKPSPNHHAHRLSSRSGRWRAGRHKLRRAPDAISSPTRSVARSWSDRRSWRAPHPHDLWRAAGALHARWPKARSSRSRPRPGRSSRPAAGPCPAQ